MLPSLEALYREFLATGDENALEQLLRRSAPTLRRLAQRLGAGAEDADDLVQETIVAAIQGADRYDTTRPLLPWLKGILTFRAAKLARDEARRRRHYAETEHLDEDVAPANAPEVAEAAAGRELDADVRAAIANLPSHYREPLRLFLLGGRSPVEIARGLGLERGTVRARLHRGLRRLRERLVRWVAPLVAFAIARPAAALVRSAGSPRRTLSLLVPIAGALAIAAWFALPDAAPHAEGTQPVITASGPELPPAGHFEASALPVHDARTGAPPPTDDRAELFVRVLDAKGRPAPGVGVTIAPAGGRDPVLHRRTEVTDAAGLVHWEGLAPMPIRLTTDRGVAERRPLRRGRNEIDVNHPAGALARGRVVDALGAPVAGAAIWLAAERDTPWRGADVARSAADGTFAVGDVAEGAVFAARHHELAGSGVARFAPSSEVELRLSGCGGHVLVDVKDENGVPVRDALVFVGEAMDAEPLWLADGAAPWRAPPFEVRTAADGRARAGALAVGIHPVHVRAPGHVPLRTEVAVVAGREIECHVTLTRGDTVHGRVTTPAGTAIAGAEVVWRASDPAGWIDLTTGPDGRFAFEGVATASGELAARAHGHRATVVAVDPGVARAGPLNLELPPARRITGSLRREDGGSVLGARMLAVWPESALHSRRVGAEVAEDGTFTWRADTELVPEVRVQLPGEPLWRTRELAISWDRDRLAVVVPLDATARSGLFGRLGTSDGRGLAHARLFVRRDARAWQEIGASDETGAFRLGPLPAGSYDLFAESTRPDLPSIAVGRYALAEAERLEVRHVAPAHGTLDLEVARSDDGDVADVVITVVGVESERRFALATRPHLRQVLVPGDYRVHVMGSRVQWLDGRAVRITAGEETRLRLVLPAAKRCHLSLVGLPARSEPTERKVNVFAAGSETPVGTFTLIADAPSRVVAVLAPGTYEVEAPQADGTLLCGSFSIPEGDAQLAPIAVQLAVRAATGR